VASSPPLPIPFPQEERGHSGGHQGASPPLSLSLSHKGKGGIPRGTRGLNHPSPCPSPTRGEGTHREAPKSLKHPSPCPSPTRGEGTHREAPRSLKPPFLKGLPPFPKGGAGGGFNTRDRAQALSNSRAMTRRWISEVPSPISISLASRR
jgi:hypothetical protein